LYQGGYHDFAIRPGGLAVYPRLVAANHGAEEDTEPLKSGIYEVDALLGGGVEFGTSVLLVGPAGSGKSTLSVQFAKAAAEAGTRAAVFAFDERRQTLLRRSRALGMDLTAVIEEGTLTVTQIDPAELSPGEFAYEVRKAVEGREGEPGAKVVVIDSLNGYMNAMPEEKFLTAQLHELLTYLGNKGVVTFLIVAQHGLFGSMQTPVDASYVADAVILFRYFEAQGRVRQAISVIKKRIGSHERAIRELRMSGRGVEVGEPLDQFQGVLTGTPRYSGSSDSLMRRDDD
jgi:circadian clock protein KaiC